MKHIKKVSIPKAQFSTDDIQSTLTYIIWIYSMLAFAKTY